MKKSIIICLLTICFYACKKTSTSSDNCDRITEINGKKLGYDGEGRLTGFYANDSEYTVAYENSNKTIKFVKISNGANSKTVLDTRKQKILEEDYTAAGILYATKAYIRDVNGYITDEATELYNTSTGSIISRTVYYYTYTLDEKGNLLKQVQTSPSNSSYRYETEFVYDVTQNFTPLIISGESLLFKGIEGMDNPLPKNRIVKIKYNGTDAKAILYAADAKGRIILNKEVPLSAGVSGLEATIKYECN